MALPGKEEEIITLCGPRCPWLWGERRESRDMPRMVLPQLCMFLSSPLWTWVLRGHSRVLGVEGALGSSHAPGEPPQSHLPPLVLLQKSLPSGWKSLREGLVHRALRDPSAALQRPALLRLLSQALGLTSAAAAPAGSYNPQAFVAEMEVSSQLQRATLCGVGTAVVLPPPRTAQPRSPVYSASSSLHRFWSS